jgi:hypothetical protein
VPVVGSARRQANAKQQVRDAHGRFAGPVERRPGAPVEPDRAPAAAPASGVVETVEYRLPDDPPPAPATGTGDPPAEQELPPASGAPAGGELPVRATGEPDPPVEREASPAGGRRPGAFFEGVLAPMIGVRR